MKETTCNQRVFLLRWLAVPMFVIGMGWQFVKSPVESSSTLPEIQNSLVDTSYIINVDSEQASFELLCDQNSSYDLIISSLGDAERTFEITFTSEVIRQSSFTTLQKLGRLQLSKKQRLLNPSISNPNRTPIAKLTAPKDRTFRLHVTDGSLNDPAQYIPVPSRIVGEGKHVRVYLDSQMKLRDLSNGLIDEIIRLFDDEIVPGFQKQIGSVRDVNADGKFTILLTPWLGKLQGGKTSLDGFVRGCDFDPNVNAPFGHQCDMMYLNTRLKPGHHLQSLLAHEFTHAILFSSRLQQVGTTTFLQYEDDWLNESIAHLGENLQGHGWSNLDYRISRFLESPQSYPLVVEDYYRSGMWRNHGCRGATYLFLRWVVDQYGNEILPVLIQSDLNGTNNLEQATGIAFAELFRRWNVAMLMSHQQSSTIDLWGQLGNWNLAGVAMVPWDIRQKSKKTITVRGTASAFLRIECGGQQQVRKISIQAKSGTQLQVTLIKRLHQNHLVKNVSGTFSGNNLQTELNYNPEDGNIEKISIEANSGNVKESICFQSKDLQARKSRSNSYTFSLPKRFQKPGTKLLIKTVAIDNQGRRTATRQTIVR